MNSFLYAFLNLILLSPFLKKDYFAFLITLVPSQFTKQKLPNIY